MTDQSKAHAPDRWPQRNDMTFAHRFGGCGALLAVAMAMGCPDAAPPVAALPSGIPVADLPAAQQALLRLTLAIDGGVLAESDLVLDGTAISGDVALNNVEADGDRTARLRLYGRASADTIEVLLGEATKDVFIARNGESRVDFSAADVFDTCGATAAPCALRYDVNRNGDSNLVDLLPVDKDGRGIDPAPQAPVLDVAPSTLQFPSGVAVGTFARQVIVLENVGPNPIRVVQAEVVAAPGQVSAARSLKPMHERQVFDRSIMIFDGVPRDRLSGLGELRTPGLADLFVAMMGGTV